MEPRLFTISYPELSIESAAFVDDFRRGHDAPKRDIVDAHFTLVFGCSAVPVDEYSSHVARVASASRPIAFECNYAMLGADDENDTAYVFLVPDIGYARISLLHDDLYTAVLRPHLRLDLPYVPHITIGATDSRTEAKELCDALNATGVSVSGWLRALTVGSVVRGKFSDVSVHTLGEA